MTGYIDTFMILLILSNVILLGSSRLGLGVRLISAQGVFVGVLPVLAGAEAALRSAVPIALATIGVKSVLFPWLMDRIMRDMPVRREQRPYLGYAASLFLGMAALGAAVWISDRLPLAGSGVDGYMMPAALFSIFTGLALIVTRRQAVSQVLGYLVMENGIFTAGMVLVPESPMFVELGVLLDLLVGVFLMGIMIFHIHREFDHIDTDRMTVLSDWKGGT